MSASAMSVSTTAVANAKSFGCEERARIQKRNHGSSHAGCPAAAALISSTKPFVNDGNHLSTASIANNTPNRILAIAHPAVEMPTRSHPRGLEIGDGDHPDAINRVHVLVGEDVG